MYGQTIALVAFDWLTWLSTKPVSQFLLALVFNVAIDITTNGRDGSSNGCQVVSVPAHRNKVWNSIRGENEVGEGTIDNCLCPRGGVWMSGGIVKPKAFLNEFISRNFCRVL
mgnify:CR=1 FL=1